MLSMSSNCILAIHNKSSGISLTLLYGDFMKCEVGNFSHNILAGYALAKSFDFTLLIILPVFRGLLCTYPPEKTSLSILYSFSVGTSF